MAAFLNESSETGQKVEALERFLNENNIRIEVGDSLTLDVVVGGARFALYDEDSPMDRPISMPRRFENIKLKLLHKE